MNLFEIFAKLNTAEEVEAFFDDLCTYAEIEKMEQRVEAAQMFLVTSVSSSGTQHPFGKSGPATAQEDPYPSSLLYSSG